MPTFELHAFPEGGRETVDFCAAVSDAAAKAKAGRLSKQIDGPVDIVRQGDGEWNDRYITTAMPSPYTTSGFMFERHIEEIDMQSDVLAAIGNHKEARGLALDDAIAACKALDVGDGYGNAGAVFDAGIRACIRAIEELKQ